MSDDTVLLETFTSEMDANVAQSVLMAAGIESHIMTDDAGGALPGLQIERGVKLFVRAADEAQAREALRS
ncbi:MAG: hypothetical protein DHS20C21_05060 [Gemmatimonadota bacterium]|nr:MAG: hypothetical protein DHS20C21_05060 [Gemmatimonadota bacterium]